MRTFDQQLEFTRDLVARARRTLAAERIATALTQGTAP